MKHPLSKFLQPLRMNFEANNISVMYRRYNNGLLFPIITDSYYKYLYKQDQIYITPWNELASCYLIKSFDTYSDCSIKDISYYSTTQLQSIFKKYGRFNISYFIPICAILLFYRTNIIRNNITDVCLIYNDQVYFYNKWGSYIKSQLTDDIFDYISDCELFFDPIYIDDDYFDLALNSRLNKIQFILATCGYSRFLDKNQKIYPKDHKDIDTLDRLRAFLLNSRQYAKMIKKDIIYERY